MFPDKPVPLADDSPGCALETNPRHIQDGSRVMSVSLNQDWASQLGIGRQGAPVVQAMATRPVVIRHPAIIIQPAEVIDE